ncbi:DUF1659 domain-containing protein [Virgibacillus sp. MG-45]|uniref:DUF1659 domain-containing protein n=1 Tax=Virgibacillus sp. MG-45 TaxID=3102791 RepID=UPI002EDA85E3
MAVADMTNSQLRLVLYDGDDAITGKPIYKAKSFNNVNFAATANQLYAVATAIAGLQQRPLYRIERKDSSDIRQA